MALVRKFLVHSLALAFVAALLTPACAFAVPSRPPAGPVSYSVSATDSLSTNAIDLAISLNSAQSELSALDGKIAIVASQTAEQSATIDAAVRSYEEAQRVYNERAVALYQGGDYDLLSILLDADSFSDLVARLELVTRILDADRYALEELEIVADEARFQAARLDTLTAQLAALRTARDQRNLTVTTSQTSLNALQMQLTTQGSLALDSVRTAEAVFRQNWVSASVPASVTVPSRNVKVSPYSDAYRSSRYHYPSYRTTDIAFSAVASYAGDAFTGCVTASGETFNATDFTCAHATLPVGTWLAVTRRDAETSQTYRVIVVVNDRGPYLAGSDLQLAKGAAAALGLIDAGAGPVDCEIVKPLP